MPIFGPKTSDCAQIVDRERLERNATGLSWREGLWTPCAAHGSSPPPLWDLGSCWHRGLRVLPLLLPSCQVAVVKIFLKKKLILLRRARGFGVAICGYIISARFGIQVNLHSILRLKHAPQIFATLTLGHMMKRLGARNIFLLSSAIAFIFNTTFFVVDLVDGGTLFLAASVVLICVTLDICLKFSIFH